MAYITVSDLFTYTLMLIAVITLCKKRVIGQKVLMDPSPNK